jgi:hypothetical protein
LPADITYTAGSEPAWSLSATSSLIAKAKLMRGLADPSRLAILESLRSRFEEMRALYLCSVESVIAARHRHAKIGAHVDTKHAECDDSDDAGEGEHGAEVRCGMDKPQAECAEKNEDR